MKHFQAGGDEWLCKNWQTITLLCAEENHLTVSRHFVTGFYPARAHRRASQRTGVGSAGARQTPVCNHGRSRTISLGVPASRRRAAFRGQVASRRRDASTPRQAAGPGSVFSGQIHHLLCSTQSVHKIICTCLRAKTLSGRPGTIKSGPIDLTEG